MPILTLDPSAITGADVPNCDWELRGQPDIGTSASIGTVLRFGTLTDGTDRIEDVPESLPGTWLVFSIPDLGVWWSFQMPGIDTILSARVDLFVPPPNPLSYLTEVEHDATLTGAGTTSDPLGAVPVAPGSSFNRDNLIAGTNIGLDDVGATDVRISATGSVSATDQVARDEAEAAQSTADGAVMVNTVQQAKLDGIETGAERNVGQQFTNAEKTKLQGIETSATQDQTGAEIVSAIDTNLGSTTWQQGGGGGGGGSTNYNDLTNKPIVRMDVPVPSAATEDVLLMDANGDIFNTVGHAHVGRIVEWGRLAIDATLVAHGGYPEVTYRGTINNTPPAGWADGDAYFEREGSNWTRNSGGHGFPYTPPNWRGAWAYKRDADASATAVDDIACFVFDPDNDNRVFAHVVITFTAGVPSSWRLVKVGYVDPGRLLRPPNYANEGMVPEVVNGQWTTVRPLSLDDIEPHVGRVPQDPPATSHERIYLTHGYSEGIREDAIITIGRSEPFGGYSAAYTGLDFGAINKPSPMARLFGTGDAVNGSNLESLQSQSNTWITDLDELWFDNVEYAFSPESHREGSLWNRRVVDYPEDVADGDYPVNYRDTEGNWYFTSGVGVQYDAGPYGLVALENGSFKYFPYRPSSSVHSSGTGDPLGIPEFEEQTYRNILGKQWNAAGQFARHAVDPTGTAAAFTHPGYVRTPSDRQDVFDDGGGDGAFTRINSNHTNSYSQIQGPTVANYTEGLLWRQVWNYRAEHVDTSGADHDLAVAYRDFGYDAAGHPSLLPVLRIVDIILAGDPLPANRYFYYLNTGHNRGLHVVTSLVPGVIEVVNETHWTGPLTTTRDVQDYVEDVFHSMVGDELQAGANITIIDNPTDSTWVISTVGGGAPFILPSPTKVEVTTTAASTAVSTGITLGAITFNNIMIQCQSPSGAVAQTIMPIAWLPVAAVGANLSTTGNSMSVPISHNRKVYFARNASNVLVFAPNNLNDVGAYHIWVTEMAVTP